MYGGGRRGENETYANDLMQDENADHGTGFTGGKPLPRNSRAFANKNRSHADELRDNSHQDDHRNQRNSFYANENPYRSKNLRS